MSKKIILFTMICAGIFTLSGCGSKPAEVSKDVSAAEGVLIERTESFPEDKEEGQGKIDKDKKQGKSGEKGTNTPSEKKESDKSSDSFEEQTGMDDSLPVNPAPPLNMEGDDLSLDELISLINAPIADARAKLEVADDSLERNGTLFGETVTVTLKSNEEILNAMQLSFAGTSIDSLQIALSEQLGNDGEQVSDGILWSTEEAFVLLYESAEGCYVDIGLE